MPEIEEDGSFSDETMIDVIVATATMAVNYHDPKVLVEKIPSDMRLTMMSVFSCLSEFINAAITEMIILEREERNG